MFNYPRQTDLSVSFWRNVMKTNTAEQQNKMTNGIAVVELHGAIKALRDDPSLGKASFRATNRWQGGALNETVIGDFYCQGQEQRHKKTLVLQNDEADALLGDDDAPNPVEFILHALAGCVTTTTVYHAAAHGIHIDALETTLEGDLDLQGLMQTDPSVPSGYQNIRVSMKIKSNADPEQIKLLENFFSFSPVFDTLTRAIPVQVCVET